MCGAVVRPRAISCLPSVVVARLDLSEQAVVLGVQTSGAQQRPRVTRHAVAEAQAPQTVVLNRHSVLPPQGPKEAARERVVRVDRAVAEIADEQRVAELSKAAGRYRQAPWGVERSARYESPHE